MIKPAEEIGDLAGVAWLCSGIAVTRGL